MKVVSFQEFNKIYQKILEDIYKYWTSQMQKEMALHCINWGPDRFNMKTYLQASAIRYYIAFRCFAEQESYQSLCDVGGFWGVFPITLKKFGFEVTLTESLRYYGAAFSGLFNFIAEQGVNIVDYDPFQTTPFPDRYDAVTVMAVLEHYPHSLKVLMKNLTSMMRPEGSLFIEVPNIAYWPKRWNLLLGKSPLTPLQDIYKSETPYIGHHHEFTISELRTLVELSDLTVQKEFFITYSSSRNPLKRIFYKPAETIIQWVWPETREVLAVLCKKDTDRGRKS
jgi:2-polyprenyl-3-methyl-5-hydroxy-6-metoxy-1,4-benzoquinol methylase